MRSVYSYRSSEDILFRERFTDPAKLHANGGTLVGSPEVDNGLHLNGTTQTSMFPLSGTDIARRALTFIQEFTPDFATSEDVQRQFYSTDVNSRHRVFKFGNPSYGLGVYMGKVNIATIAEATYSPYWRVGELNRLIVSTESGHTDVWLRGVKILSADVTIYPLEYPTALWVGSSYVPGDFLSGIVNSMDVRAGRLTQLDVDAIENGSMFTYQNRSELWADMKSAIVNGVNDRTPDKSKYGRTILLGDGAGMGTPTWTGDSFLFDAVDDYMTLPADPTGTFTVVTKRTEDLVPVFENDLTTYTKIKTPGQLSGTLEFLSWFPFILSPIQQKDFEYQLRWIV